MKFIKLESRGGNYLVVASNVAWLRVAENGQTSVGIVGGQPLLVVGSPEEVAAKILDAAGNEPDAAPAKTRGYPCPCSHRRTTQARDAQRHQPVRAYRCCRRAQGQGRQPALDGRTRIAISAVRLRCDQE